MRVPDGDTRVELRGGGGSRGGGGGGGDDFPEYSRVEIG